MVIFIILPIVFGIIWGLVVDKVIENKGYTDNWFWWGFFFGVFALIVALTKPDVQYESQPIIDPDLITLQQGGWKCFDCGKINPAYVTTCSCGMTKIENGVKLAEKEKLNKLKEYKELLENGIISQEEFEQKKAQILNS